MHLGIPTDVNVFASRAHCVDFPLRSSPSKTINAPRCCGVAWVVVLKLFDILFVCCMYVFICLTQWKTSKLVL